jgi:hypothetical protein
VYIGGNERPTGPAWTFSKRPVKIVSDSPHGFAGAGPASPISGWMGAKARLGRRFRGKRRDPGHCDKRCRENRSGLHPKFSLKVFCLPDSNLLAGPNRQSALPGTQMQRSIIRSCLSESNKLALGGGLQAAIWRDLSKS